MMLEISVVMVMMGNFDLLLIYFKVVFLIEVMIGGLYFMLSWVWFFFCFIGFRMWLCFIIVVCGWIIRIVIFIWINVE